MGGSGAEARGRLSPFIIIGIPTWTMKMFTFAGLANGVVCILEVGRKVLMKITKVGYIGYLSPIRRDGTIEALLLIGAVRYS